MLLELAPKEVVYFEMNNWFPERDYPYDEPYTTWFGVDLNLWLYNDEWVRANKICVVTHPVDMAVNFMVTAPKTWVEAKCPTLLTHYTQFLRYPDKDGQVYGMFGTKFLPYSLSNIGVHEIEYNYWEHMKDEDNDSIEEGAE